MVRAFKHTANTAALALCATMFATPSLAVTANAGPANITQYNAGWVEARAIVYLDIPQVNPENCPQTGYITNEHTGGGQLFNTVLLTAFSTHRRVTITVEGCYLGWPQIIGVIIHP